MTEEISIRPLAEKDLDEADRLFRLAFGTFLNLPDPMMFAGDTDYFHTRWKSDPSAVLGAYAKDTLAGSIIAVNWGSVGFFGPLTVHPDYWDRGVGKKLIHAVMEIFDGWGIKNAGLYTFPHSTKHLGLYQKFNFWPGFLTPVMSKPVQKSETTVNWIPFSEFTKTEQEQWRDACRGLTGEIYSGLDLSREIDAVQDQKLGETVLLREGNELAAFAVCHCGPKTEAGSGSCYIKFAAVKPGPDAHTRFGNLLVACEAMAAGKNLIRLVGGVNTVHHEAYREMIARGFRSDFQGVMMHFNNDPGYNRPEYYLLGDWR